MCPDFLDRMDAWNKATKTPEKTSSFLRAPTVDDLGMNNPKFGREVGVASPTSQTINPATNGAPQSAVSKTTPDKENVENIPVESGKNNPDVKPAEKMSKSDDSHGDCGCPVSAALNSIKEEAEAADLYMKRANHVDDPHAQEVYRDIAKEEVVHMGEAAELLREADPELAAEAPKGMDEAKGVSGNDEKGEWKPDIDKAIDDRQ